MAYYDPNGREVTAADALSNGKLRNGYRQTFNPGERLSFDMLMFDAAPRQRLTDEQRHREVINTLRKGRYLNMGGFIEAADSENPARPTAPSGMSPKDAVAYLRKARYA